MLAGTRQLRSQGLVPVHAHVPRYGKARTGLGAGSEMAAGSGAGMERERKRERGWKRTKERKVAGTRTGSGRAEERRRSARNLTRVVDALWETGETWVERGKKRRHEIL